MQATMEPREATPQLPPSGSETVVDAVANDNASIDSGFHSSSEKETTSHTEEQHEQIQERARDSRSTRNSSVVAPSPSPSPSAPSCIGFSQQHLDYINAQLEHMHPRDILRFAKILFPNLYQTTAFGLTGLATLHMLVDLQREDPTARPVEAIFLDTLHHFPETYELVGHVRARYPSVAIHVYKPSGASTASEFEGLYGARLYETSSELYDWVAKVEPQQRAWSELGVAAVLTGRRRSQGGARGSIPVVEMDDESGGVFKINPLVNWPFAQVKSYVDENCIPYNALLDRGYKSVGDWHATSPVAEGEDERAGRWKGQQKTECGIHNKKSRYAQFSREQAATEPNNTQVKVS